MAEAQTKAVWIVGKGKSSGFLVGGNAADGRELWTLNNDYRAGTTRHFDMHVPATHLAELRRRSPGALFVTLDSNVADSDPLARLFPMDEARQFFGWPEGEEYLANSVAYMLAMALMEGFNPLILCGVDYDWHNRQESLWERPCTEFYLGWAKARGTQVIVPGASHIFATGEGPDRRPYGMHKLKRNSVVHTLPCVFGVNA